MLHLHHVQSPTKMLPYKREVLKTLCRFILLAGSEQDSRFMDSDNPKIYWIV